MSPDSAPRILFPFFGERLSRAALDAAIRLCKADGAMLVPAYLAEVPLNMPLDAALSRQAEQAIGVLEAVEQRALTAGVEVDSRIERGRTHRHALLHLLDNERYDRIVAAAETRNGDGLTADDIAWLLSHTAGEVVVLRAGAARS